MRGATGHYDTVVGGATSGCLNASTDSGVPVIFGVLTTETMEQVGGWGGWVVESRNVHLKGCLPGRVLVSPTRHSTHTPTLRRLWTARAARWATRAARLL